MVVIVSLEVVSSGLSGISISGIFVVVLVVMIETLVVKRAECEL